MLRVGRVRLSIASLCLTTMFAHAGQTVDTNKQALGFYDYRPADIDCVIEAAAKQGIPSNVLLAIASIESGRNGQFVKNTNGSLDIGHFQINTIHWRNTKHRKGMFANYPKITPEEVAWRGCYNAELAAWMIRKKIDESNGQDFWTRVANYHSYTNGFNTIYKNKLIPLSIQWGDWLRNKYSTTSVSYK